MRALSLNRLSNRLTDRFSRRSLIGGGAGTLATTALAALAANDVLGQAATPEPQLREFTLTASEFDWQLMEDVTVRVWGYNGQMPGPELRAREGDTVRVTLINQLPVPTTIHWHGVNVRPAMDGVAGLNQAAIDPGATFTYEFVATPAGTRWYHSHTDPALQVPMGLYGPLIIEPANPGEQYDRDYTLMLAEWDLELTPAVAAGASKPGPGDQTLRGGQLGADFFLINGKMNGSIPPLRIAKDERMLVRLINAGAIPHPIHTHGHSFTITATDGNLVPEVARLTKDTVLIAPAERYDLAIRGDNPGVWMFHCHIEHHMANGMMTTIWYDGEQPTGPYVDVTAGQAGGMDGMGGMDMGGTPEAHDTVTPAPTEAPAATSGADANAFVVEMADNRFVPAQATVALGTTVAWVNNGRNWHSVAAYDGSFTSGKIAPGERFTHQFTKTGVFKYICQHHGLQGMIGMITVQ